MACHSGQSGVGSSPLTRGKQVGAGFRRLKGRLIPAHAGKTASDCRILADFPAHPRSRGENPSSTTASGIGSGSSPLTRGKPNVTMSVASQRRLIPAHAGKTRGQLIVLRGSGAHPRSRGENRGTCPACCDDRGSSPLTRGKRCFDGQAASVHRLIPAHAGKTHAGLRG